MQRLNSSLKKILEFLPISIVITSLESGTIIWVNSRDMQLAGATSPDQIVGHNLLEFLNPDQHGIALRDFALVAEGASPPPMMYCLRRLDGGSADVQISSIPVRFEGQRAMLSICADVTEQQRARRACVESEERYRSLVETSPNGVVVILDTEETVYVNPALCGILGTDSPETLLRKPMRSYIHPDELKAVREGRAYVLETHETIPPTPARLVRLDGEAVSVFAQTTFVRWQGENATQTVLHVGSV